MDYEEQETIFFNAIMVSDDVPDSADEFDDDLDDLVELPISNLKSKLESDSESDSEIDRDKVRKRLFKNCQFILKSGTCCKLNAKQGKNHCWRHQSD
jgi:hypothetical protein